MKILASYNIKGGVGKTAATVNLAFFASLEGNATLVCDLDAQGAATYCFRIKPRIKGGSKKLFKHTRALEGLIRGTDFERLDLLPADFSHRKSDLFLAQANHPRKQLTRLLDQVRDEYDYVLLDCPPGISLLSENVFEAADALLVPTIPTPLSLRTLKQLKKHLGRDRAEKPLVLPFFSMVDRRKSLHREICGEQGAKPEGFLTAQVPYSTLVEQMSVERSPVAAYAPACEAARAFSALWCEVTGRLRSWE